MQRTTFYMSENFEFPPFFTTGQYDEELDIEPQYVKLKVNVLPMRREPDFWAIVKRCDWQPLWQRLAEADRAATDLLAARDARYDNARKIPLVGRLVGALRDASTTGAYYEVERASFLASRELLLLLDRHATGEEKLSSQRFLNTYKRDIGTWLSDSGPPRS